MRVIDQITDRYPDEQFLFPIGYEDAIIGIDTDSMQLILSVKKGIEIACKEIEVTKADLSKEEIADGMTVNDKRMEIAIEHFEYNVRGSKGEGFPIWCEDDF